MSDTGSPQFNNGQYWVEYLAPKLGFGYDQATNYSVAGATSSEVYSQVDNYRNTNGSADPNALYVIQGGANSLFPLSTENDESVIQSTVESVVAELISMVNILKDIGAQNVLVTNMADLGGLPIYYGEADKKAAMTDVSQRYNTALNLGLGLGADAIVDIVDLNQSLSDTALLATYGITNTVGPCKISPIPNACDNSLFWDGVHVTTLGHQVIADQMFNSIGNATNVSEPSTLALLSLGLVGLGYARRKSQA